MSVLLIQIPPRKRLGARAGGGEDPTASAPAVRGEYAWARTDDGIAIHSHGRAVPALLPQADIVVAVLADTDVGWQRITIPKAPPTRLRAAVGGVLEDFLLDEPEALHLALAPDFVGGTPAWVAVIDKGWLAGEIATLERAGHLVDRVVPSIWPGEAPFGHFFDAAGGNGTPEPAIAMADMNGIVCLPLAGSLARALLPATAAETIRWTATPAVAAPAERWLGAPVQVQSEHERLLGAARSLWNLRQFDLAPSRRGTRAARDVLKRLMGPAWRPVRTGVIALLALQIVGLNAYAWNQRKAVDEKRRAQAALLTQTHPQVRTVLDAPLQMERETEALRTAAGRPGPTDLEPMLTAAAAAWPDAQGPLQTLRYQPGQLTLATPGWSDNDVKQFIDRLRPGGWAVEHAPGRVTMARAPANPAANP
jgi:general secretion pathway protein L